MSELHIVLITCIHIMHSETDTEKGYRQVSNISRTLVGN